MGVFARLRRKSRRTAEEVGSASPAAEATEDGTPAPEASGAVPDTVTDSGSDCGAGDGDDGGTKAADGVDIPKQQTAGAADTGVGEGARA
ncbi:hypothetical protein ACFXI8_14345 [Streptomyces niveus]|uniref:hypothetical protein n=1 Tax=Streptomyces niveus TaxID=193462 RepID=UPI003683E90D